jgi:HK97 family phage portal protein
MSARAVISRALRTLTKAVEGAVRPGPYFLPISGGWLPDGSPTNWWQIGQDIQPSPGRSAMVEACVSAYSQTIAMCPGAHWRLDGKGGKVRITTSSLSRVLRCPNPYQTMSDFLLNATRQLYLDGNCYALALRNDRYEIDEIHLMDSYLSRPQLAANGEVFYRLAGNQIIEYQIEGPLVVPQRDVLHIRLHVDRSRRYPFPLWGMSPLLAALDEISVSEAIAQQQLQFYLNQARPAAVLSTDMVLPPETVQALGERWDEKSKGLNQGKTPILTAGLKVQPWGATAKDAQIAEILKISEEKIALVFRIPLQILGYGDRPTGSSVEALMQFWIATGLGFALNHIEEAFGLLFSLKGQPDEYVEFDTSALLRSAQKDRIEALARGVQGGIYSPNEARGLEGLPETPAGAEPRVQAQVVPLSAANSIPATSGPHPPSPMPDAAPPAPIVPPAPPPKADPDAAKRAAAKIHARAARAARHFN